MSTDRSSDLEDEQAYQHDHGDTGERNQNDPGDVARFHGHELVAVDEWLPGTEPTPYELDLTEGYEYRTRYWRCRNCGQERNRREEFTDECETPVSSTPLEAGGYSIDDARTRRALSEDIDVRFATMGPRYEVTGESGRTYEVDVLEETCSCPDFEQRQPDGGCKHLRRVDLEIRTGRIPSPNGAFTH